MELSLKFWKPQKLFSNYSEEQKIPLKVIDNVESEFILTEFFI